MQKIEHIGIAVKDLDQAEAIYSAILSTQSYKREIVESEKVITSFFQKGPNKIELLAATDEDSVIHSFIAKKGEGIHHIAFAVENIYMEMERLQKAGFTLLNEKPKQGADNKLICFLHPRDTSGVLIELCQDIN